MSIKSPYQHEIKERKKGDTLRKSGQNFFANSDKKYNVSNNNYIDSYSNTKQSKPVKLDSSTRKNLFDKNSNNSLCPNYNMEERNEINPGISGINKDSLERIRDINTKEQLEKLMNKNNTKHDLDGLTDKLLFNNQINLNNNGNNNNNSKNLIRNNSDYNRNNNVNQININNNNDISQI